ncbi:hypothetical protein AYI68_g1317 [Smittium mucronatum]|uniref:Uncharacterized protein n=1 Tax=Smittium mucronatum TaxID=133383 RepID=A0A1R0H601_9FUNG|nr:hypothetical protein AYI68_g1317 [Smittium mucronatum]
MKLQIPMYLVNHSKNPQTGKYSKKGQKIQTNPDFPKFEKGEGISSQKGTKNERISLSFSESKSAGSISKGRSKYSGIFRDTIKINVPSYNHYKSEPTLEAGGKLQWESIGSTRFN